MHCLTLHCLFSLCSGKCLQSQYLFLRQPIREPFINWIKLRSLSCFMSTLLTETFFHSALQITAQAPKRCQLTSTRGEVSISENILRASHFNRLWTGMKSWLKVCIKRRTSTVPSNPIKAVFCPRWLSRVCFMSKKFDEARFGSCFSGHRILH